MTEEECEQLFQGHEDAQGNIHYEGRSITAGISNRITQISSHACLSIMVLGHKMMLRLSETLINAGLPDTV